EAATAAQQLEIAKKIQASQGWNAWPVCSHK
ncbi:peptidoglycan-binding protein, partial [Escherichia coli]|nr:peptidoglycan-binding protein [Escherichia coli]